MFGPSPTGAWWHSFGRGRSARASGSSREEMEQEIEAFVRNVQGDILPMKWARYRRRASRAGSRIVGKMGLRNALRPAAEWVVRRF